MLYNYYLSRQFIDFETLLKPQTDLNGKCLLGLVGDR